MPAKRIPKEEWGDGPWQNEPDHVSFEHEGFPCILHRNNLGAWCGYVGVPEGHPWHGKGYDDVLQKNGERPDVHGGLTYAEPCQGDICHTGEANDHRWWQGFDCCHAQDFAPETAAALRSFRDPKMHHATEWFGEAVNYKDLAYVRAETEGLARQAKEAAALTRQPDEEQSP